MQAHIFKMPFAASGQVVGYWRGGRLGVISFRYEGATACGVICDGNSVRRQGWGLSTEASTQRLIRAITDIRGPRITDSECMLKSTQGNSDDFE